MTNARGGRVLVQTRTLHQENKRFDPAEQGSADAARPHWHGQAWFQVPGVGQPGTMAGSQSDIVTNERERTRRRSHYVNRCSNTYLT